MKALHMVSFALVVIGALNWGLVGLLNGYNLVNAILGSFPVVERLVYVLVGLAALYLLATHRKDCRVCGSTSQSPAM